MTSVCVYVWDMLKQNSTWGHTGYVLISFVPCKKFLTRRTYAGYWFSCEWPWGASPLSLTYVVRILTTAALHESKDSQKTSSSSKERDTKLSSQHVQCWGYLISSDHLLYRVTPLKTPFGLVIPLLQSQSHVTTITHNCFLRCYTCTQLTITYTFVTTITCSTLARLHSLRALHSNLYCTIAHKVS
jgi:hypothetical protein